MLDAHEIELLEKKYKTYKIKRLIKFTIPTISIFIVLIIALIVSSISTNKTTNTSNIKKEKIKIVSHETQNIKKENIKNELVVIPKPITNNFIENNEENHNKLELLPVAEKEIINEDSPIIKHENKNVYNQAQNTYFSTPKVPVPNLQIPLKQNVNVQTQVTPKVITPPVIEVKQEPIKQEPKEIKVEIVKHDKKTKDNQNITYLKSKFNSTKNIYFALMIAQEYYSVADYENSIQWALSANEIDPNNEKSWLIFAKSKAKIGDSQSAISVLKSYISNSSSQKAEILLEEIKKGTL